MTLRFSSFTNTKQSLQYTIKTHRGSPPMPKFKANINRIPTYKTSQFHETVQQKCYNFMWNYFELQRAGRNLRCCDTIGRYDFLLVKILHQRTSLPRDFVISYKMQLISCFNMIMWYHTSMKCIKPFPKRQILDSSKLTKFTDDNFKLNENRRKFFKWVENTVGKRRNCSSRAISPFPTVLSKGLYCKHVKTRACLGKG